MRMKPKIGITIGDYNGIGPEVALKALRNKKILKLCNPIVIIDQSLLDKFGRNLDERIKFNLRKNKVQINPGKPTLLSGKASLDYINEGINLIKDKHIDCLVTAPISKTAISLAGSKFKGHTDMLQSVFKVENIVMSFYSKDFKVSLASIHIPIKKVVSEITESKIYNQILILNKSLKKYFNIKNPRIGVCGLNPHASEDGNIGVEDLEIISPAIEAAKKDGVKVQGPFPADTLFVERNRKNFDIIHAIYHDQGLIPFKMKCFDEGVNVTLNLPFIRTSPDHGTAYDLAWKNKASSKSMEEAILLAIKIYKNS